LSLRIFILISFYNLLEDVTCFSMIEFRVGRIDWEKWVFINCLESIILYINFEVLFFLFILIFSHQSELISAFPTLLFSSLPQFFLWLLLFLQRRNLTLNFWLFSFWWTKSTVETNDKFFTVILTSVLFIAFLFPIRNDLILINLLK